MYFIDSYDHQTLNFKVNNENKSYELFTDDGRCVLQVFDLETMNIFRSYSGRQVQIHVGIYYTVVRFSSGEILLKIPAKSCIVNLADRITLLVEDQSLDEVPALHIALFNNANFSVYADEEKLHGAVTIELHDGNVSALSWSRTMIGGDPNKIILDTIQE